MLAITERLVLDSWLDWALCDTDRLAIAKPAEMDELNSMAGHKELVRRE